MFRAIQPGVAGVWNAPPRVEPPGYYLLLHAWLAQGRGEECARALSAVLGTLALWLAWRLLRRRLEPSVALGALALASASPLQIIYAQQARPYMLREALELGALLALGRAAADPARARAWAAFTGCAALAALTHTLALLWWPCWAAWLALGGFASRRTLRPFLACGAAAAAPALLLAWQRRDVIAHVNLAGHRAVPAADLAIGAAQLFGAGGYCPPALAAPAAGLFGALALAALLVAAVRPRRSPATVALLTLGVLPLALLWLANQAGLVYQPKLRYMLTAQLFLLAACAQGAALAPVRWARRALMAALLLAQAAALAGYLGEGDPALDLPPLQKPFRAAARLILARARPGDAVVSTEFVTFVPMAWYLHGALSHAYPAADPLVTDAEMAALGRPTPLSRVAPGAGRIWVVTAPVFFATPPVVPGDVAAELARRAIRRERLDLPGLRIERWDRRP